MVATALFNKQASFFLNKQQILFLCVLLVGGGTLWHTRQIVIEQPAGQQQQLHKTWEIVKYRQEEVLIQKPYYTYFPSAARDIFSAVKKRKQLPPIDLPLPAWNKFSSLALIPIPAPASKYWHLYLPSSPSSLEVTSLPEIPSASVNEAAEKKPTPLAQELSEKIRPHTIVKMNNNREFQGKLIKQSSTEVIISDPQSQRNFTLPKSQINEILLAQSLTEVLAEERRKAKYQSAAEKISLAQAANELGQQEFAETLLKQTIAEHPRQEDPYLALANHYLDNFAYDQAYKICAQAEKALAKSSGIRYTKAQMEMALGLNNKALESVQASSSETKEASLLKVLLLIKQQRFAQARQELAELQELFPQEQEILYRQAYLEFHENRLDHSLATLEKMAGTSAWGAKRDNLQGVIYYLQGQLGKAESSLRKALEHGHLPAAYNLALCYAASGSSSAAVNLLQNLNQHPGMFTWHPQVYASLGWIYTQLKEKSGMTLLEKALEMAPDNPWIQYLWGEASLAQEGEKDLLAIYRAYREALDQDFHFTQALLRLAEVAQMSKNYPDSLLYLQEALHRKEFLSSSLQMELRQKIAWLELAQGNFPAAEEILYQLLKEGAAASSFAHKLLAYLLQKRGDFEAALLYLEKVLQQHPQDSYAKEIRQKILANVSRTLWEDQFTRQDSPRVRRGWREEESNGVLISLSNQQVLFSGKQFADQSPTLLYRHSTWQNFIAISAEIGPHTSGITSGIFVAWHELNKGVYFARDEQNRLVYSVGKHDDKWQPINNMVIPAEQQVKLTIQFFPEQKQYQLLLADKVVVAKSKLPISPSTSYELKVGMFGQSEAGKVWNCHFDNARLIEETQEKR